LPRVPFLAIESMTMQSLIDIITSDDDQLRNQSLDAVCQNATLVELQKVAAELDGYRRTEKNLYHRVRALFFLTSIYRYQLPGRLPVNLGQVPYEGFQHLLERRFREAIDTFLACQAKFGPSDALASALAQAYRQLAFQTLANQVRHSVRAVRGNQWMFRLGHPQDQPLRIRSELLIQDSRDGSFPLLCERTAVRMDFSHSAWSDIFFLGMDFPEGARVLNVSIDLGVRGRDPVPRPPIETYLRVIDRPVLRLVSVDLDAATELTHVHELFDFARDYLGLLKASVIAAGIVPPGMEGSQQELSELFGRMIGPGLGLELVSQVNDIPKGSRLAVSTNLLGSLISICMRGTSQVSRLVGSLDEPDRRIVAARAILGEWIGGSGGGWQDSGGIWPGIKLITGAKAAVGDPEHGISRGRLLPSHQILAADRVSPDVRQRLQESLVLVHGGMAQNVGPILEMVTEKYLLRSHQEWEARQEAMSILDRVVKSLEQGDIPAVGAATTRNFRGPLQTIIPWSTNRYTDQLIDRAEQAFGEDFWGFWMLGGMAGGGMGFIFAPHRKVEAQNWLQAAMSQTKRELEHALPFAMEPLVYDFAINDRGTSAELRAGKEAAMPAGYYGLLAPGWLRVPTRELSPQIRLELERLATACQDTQDQRGVGRRLLQRLLPQPERGVVEQGNLAGLLAEHGFDPQQHEQIRGDLRAGRIGLAQNRLPPNVSIEDVASSDYLDVRSGTYPERWNQLGVEALQSGKIAVVTLAAGVGSRWTEGAGVVKALHPFCKIAGRHRNFLEVHLAKSRAIGSEFGSPPPHVFTTGYLTNGPIREHLALFRNYGYEGPVHVSPGRSVGLRMVPMVRDLRFEWEEMAQQLLDEQQQKLRASLRGALIHWAQRMGEGEDYTDNVPQQCMHPVGHWYEIPNVLRNGTLARLIAETPQLCYLLLHNIDTLGAHLSPGLLGAHIDTGACLSFEVIPRRLEDRGGGLARVQGKVRLLEGLAMPREEDEFRLSLYSSMTTWIDIDQLLETFGLSRATLADQDQVDQAVRRMSRRVPTYVTLKDVKKRWGHGQEDVFPVAQFEKLWGDMTMLPEISCRFLLTPIERGQQLKQQSQLDGWLRDGSAARIAALCHWGADGS
jgi:hypothetical protein